VWQKAGRMGRLFALNRLNFVLFLLI